MNKNLLRFLSICVIMLISASVFAQNAPVKVTDFTVSAKEKKVVIDWKTDVAETDNYFAIQKSDDGITYKTIALVLGPDPKQQNCNCYEASDKSSTKTAKQYYRLVQVIPNGAEHISETKVLAKT